MGFAVHAGRQEWLEKTAWIASTPARLPGGDVAIEMQNWSLRRLIGLDRLCVPSRSRLSGAVHKSRAWETMWEWNPH